MAAALYSVDVAGTQVWLLLLCQAIGVELDLADKGLGIRSRRYAMLLDDGSVSFIMFCGACARSDCMQLAHVSSFNSTFVHGFAVLICKPLAADSIHSLLLGSLHQIGDAHDKHLLGRMFVGVQPTFALACCQACIFIGADFE